jgi:collagenase-like PrtC family protease
MVNEFCCIGPEGDGTSTTYCIYRDSCYLCHAEDLTAEDSGLFEAYPMSRCVQSRHAPEIWLKANFIRPEDVPRYAELGIGDFKITGRTGGTEFLLSLADAYVRGRLEGNLLSLWKHLETIGSGMSELEWAPSCYIDNAKLEHFVDWWFDDPERDCANEVCGETCTYCDGFLG